MARSDCISKDCRKWFEPFASGPVSNNRAQDSVHNDWQMMKTRTIKFFLFLSVLLAPLLVVAAPLSQVHQAGALAVSSAGQVLAGDAASVQHAVGEHLASASGSGTHRCADGGCSSVGCCVASDDYLPSLRLFSSAPEFITILASVTEVFLSSDTRPPIPSA